MRESGLMGRSFVIPKQLLWDAWLQVKDQKWVLLYVERWLAAPMQTPDGSLLPREKGTRQGSPISPVLANIFLHYGLDLWMAREFPAVPFERYADDAVIHCATERQAWDVQRALAARLVDVGLELHPEKTRIVYCRDSKRRSSREHISFTFCGYAFRPRKAYDKATQRAFTSFLPAVSPRQLSEFSRRIASWRLHRRTTRTLDDLAREVNPAVRGWLAYYTAFYPTAVIPLCHRIDRHLVRWARWKYRRLERGHQRAWAWLDGVRLREPALFAHWRYCSCEP